MKSSSQNFLYLCVTLFFLLFVSACEDDYLTINAFEAEGTTVNYHAKDTGIALKVAIVSMICSPEKEDNLQKIIDFIEMIMRTEPDVELISFGESITGFYAESPDYIRQLAESIPGPFTDTLSYYAQKHGIHLSFGMAENHTSDIFNSLVVLDPTGQILSLHRKNTLTPEDVNAGYSSMRNANVIQIKDFLIGLMICADVNGAWLTQQYIASQIDIILSAFASPIGAPSFNIISRRMNAWQIFPNRFGNENGASYSGLIYVSDPAGNLVNQSIRKEGFITYTITK